MEETGARFFEEPVGVLKETRRDPARMTECLLVDLRMVRHPGDRHGVTRPEQPFPPDGGASVPGNVGTPAGGYGGETDAATVTRMSTTTATATTITLAYDGTNPYQVTHLYEDGRTLCGVDASDMERFDTTIRGRRAVEDFVDCALCSRAARDR